jgi:hypothetical protein
VIATRLTLAPAIKAAKAQGRKLAINGTGTGLPKSRGVEELGPILIGRHRSGRYWCCRQVCLTATAPGSSVNTVGVIIVIVGICSVVIGGPIFVNVPTRTRRPGRECRT